MQVTPGAPGHCWWSPTVSDPSPVPEQTLRLELGRGDVSITLTLHQNRVLPWDFTLGERITRPLSS